jgi:hypothetical protein
VLHPNKASPPFIVVQRTDGALRLNPHLHVVALDLVRCIHEVGAQVDLNFVSPADRLIVNFAEGLTSNAGDRSGGYDVHRGGVTA